MSKARRKDAVDRLLQRFNGGEPRKQAILDQELVNARAAQLIFDMRQAAGLSQRDLARQVRTTASVICRLEAADYSGHTLSMLNRIASALGRRIELHAVPKEAA